MFGQNYIIRRSPELTTPTWNMAVGSGHSSSPVPPTRALPDPVGLPLSRMLWTARCAATRELEHAVSTDVLTPWKPYR